MPVIGKKVAFGGVLMVGARLITRLFDLGIMLVLARLLQPQDFGLVAMAMSLIFITEVATELPLNQALVRLPTVTRAHYDTAFTLSALRGAFLSVVLVVSAWPFAKFYGDGRLFPLVCVLSIAPLARSLISPRLAEFQKHMSFWRDFTLELTGKAASLVAASVLAFLTHSYWSLAAATVAVPLASGVLSYLLAPYRPRFALSELPAFSGFIGWMAVAQGIGAFNWQFERLLLGRLKGKAELGLFATASDLAAIPLLALFGPILRPLLAAFSHLQADTGRLAASYQTACSAVVAIGLPILLGEALVAHPAVRLILGEKWLGSVELLRWLALSAIPSLLALPAIPLIMSQGNTRIILKRNLLEFCVKFPIAMIGTLKFGFTGIVVSRFVSELVAGIFCMRVVRRTVGLSIKDQLLVSWRSAAGAVVMAATVSISMRLCSGDERATGAALQLAVATCVGAGTYGAMLWALWKRAGCPRGAEAMVVDTIATMFKRILGFNGKQDDTEADISNALPAASCRGKEGLLF